MPPIAKTSAELLLNAAQTVVLRDGIVHLTLDAVAREAGVSKGGVLHYYPNKNALMEGLVMNLLDTFDAEIERLISADPIKQGRFCRAYVKATLSQAHDHLAVSAALLTAAATIEPRLLTQVRERDTLWRQRSQADGLDPDTATLLLLAADGFCFYQLFEFGKGTEQTADAAPLERAAERLTKAGTTL
jgi:AcrR family transcriptional regulator